MSERYSDFDVFTGSKEIKEEINPSPQLNPYKFWGGSEIINPFGKQIAKAVLYEEDEIFGQISKDLLRRKKILLPYLRNDDPYFTHRQLQNILYGHGHKK